MPKAKKRFRIRVDHRYCAGCGNCIAYCPQHVLAREIDLNSRGIYAPKVDAAEQCTGCQLCEMYCGNFAIAVGPLPDAGE